MKKLLTISVLVTTCTHAAEMATQMPVLTVHMHTASPRRTKEITEIVDGEKIKWMQSYDSSENAKYTEHKYAHTEKIQIPQIKNIRDKDIYNHLNKKQQNLFGIQYNEGRLYLNGKDISSRAVPVAGLFSPHMKDNEVKNLVFVSYLFASTIPNGRDSYSVDITPNGITLVSNIPPTKE